MKTTTATSKKKITSQLEQMDKNAEMVITRHRALFAKPGQLKDMVKLPAAKRSNSGKRSTAAMTTVEALLEVPYD